LFLFCLSLSCVPYLASFSGFWQHRVHKTKKKTQKQSRETGKIGYTRQRQTKQKQSRETGNTGYTG
jgi:hypothetical protein